MKKITKSMPAGHIMLGSLFRNQIFKFRSVTDDSLFISFVAKANRLMIILIKEVKTEKRHLQNFNFWSQFLFPINTI
ncbi:hypothetical protein [Labilibaculum euxinus]